MVGNVSNVEGRYLESSLTVGNAQPAISNSAFPTSSLGSKLMSGHLTLLESEQFRNYQQLLLDYRGSLFGSTLEE